MTDDPNDLDGLLEQLAGEDGPPDPAGHPVSEVLSAYSAHALPPEEELRVQEHLAVCRRCRDLLLDFASFRETPLAERVEGVTDLAAAVEWRALRERMAREIGEPERPWEREPARDDRLVRRLRVFQALAAVLGVMVVGLSMYAVRPHGRSDVLLVPKKTLDFSQTRGEKQPKETLRLPCALRFFVASDHQSYKIEILSADGQPVYSGGPYRRLELEGLTLPLPYGVLAPGTYTIRLYGFRPGQPQELIGKPVKLLVTP